VADLGPNGFGAWALIELTTSKQGWSSIELERLWRPQTVTGLGAYQAWYIANSGVRVGITLRRQISIVNRSSTSQETIWKDALFLSNL